MAGIWFKCKASIGCNVSEVNSVGSSAKDFADECFQYAYQIASEVFTADDSGIRVECEIAGRKYDFTFSAELLAKEELYDKDFEEFRNALLEEIDSALYDAKRSADDETGAECVRLLKEAEKW